MSDFIDVQGQLVRESAITRLSRVSAAGVPVNQHYVHFVDGGALAVSEPQFLRKLKKRFEPPKPGRKSA
jgi:hypothetical protein